MDDKMVDAGTIRLSQLIDTFGPGSLVNLQNDTVMILGLEFWPKNTEHNKYIKEISHPYLSQQLKRNFFQLLVSDGKSHIPCISFPQWKLCQRCHRLQKTPTRCTDSKGFICTNCHDPNLSLFHAYFVQICDNGHISEFPWEMWAHFPEELDGQIKLCTKKKGEEPKLEFITTGKGISWFNYKIKCLHCGSERSMREATSKKIFRRFNFNTCYGYQPWLSNSDEKCNEDVYGIQVNSTATYYPFNTTALLIPKWINPVDELLDRNEGLLRKMIMNGYENGRTTDMIFEWHKNDFKEILNEYTESEIKNMLDSKFITLDDDVSVEGRALEQEFDDFITITKRIQRGPEHDHKIDIEPLKVQNSLLEKYHIKYLMKFHRLIAIKTLRGFTRGIPPDPFATESQLENKKNFRPINSNRTLNSNRTSIDWLPAVETKGEGIFFSFDDDMLSTWEQIPKVRERYNIILDSYAANLDKRKRTEKDIIKKTFSSPRYIFLHTFAHLLIREIANHSGYHEASLKERIYSTTEKQKRNGILIYTSSASSGGSLGGLVRLGSVKRFEEIIRNTIKRSDACSGDPLCGERDPVVLKKELALDMKYSGSACYACTILSETSCQNFNNLLDRWMLRDLKYGFFRDILKDL